ncbi:MAG TPA: hypothetical protein VG963_05195, partial [Polyangiaceae bacterium]|nr:hypothetical protein [Polyangiaceae bacterium]
WLRKHALALVLSLLVCAGFVWLLKRGALPVVPPRSAWSTLSPWTLVLYTLAFVGVHISRCARWRLLASQEERPSTGLSIAIGLVGEPS